MCLIICSQMLIQSVGEMMLLGLQNQEFFLVNFDN